MAILSLPLQLSEFAKLLSAETLLEWFVTLLVKKSLKFPGKQLITSSEDLCESIFFAKHQTTS